MKSPNNAMKQFKILYETKGHWGGESEQKREVRGNTAADRVPPIECLWTAVGARKERDVDKIRLFIGRAR